MHRMKAHKLHIQRYYMQKQITSIKISLKKGGKTNKQTNKQNKTNKQKQTKNKQNKTNKHSRQRKTTKNKTKNQTKQTNKNKKTKQNKKQIKTNRWHSFYQNQSNFLLTCIKTTPIE